MLWQSVLAALAICLNVSALPQGVTSAIAPPLPFPSGCNPNLPSTFGIEAVSMAPAGNIVVVEKRKHAHTLTSTSSRGAIATQMSDGQPGAGIKTDSKSSESHPHPSGPLYSQSASPTVPVQQISDGQIQHQTCVPIPQPYPIGQISDGQVQHQSGVYPSRPSVCPVSGEGQRQSCPSSAQPPVNQISDGQVQDMETTTTITTTVESTSTIKKTAPTEIQNSGRIQARSEWVTALHSSDPMITVTKTLFQPSVGKNLENAREERRDDAAQEACKNDATLALRLENGQLFDRFGRTGYIASNYQFQFDKPPQAGAIFTSGFSVCGNGSLALGGSTTFWQCRSGDFYNLYDRWWAAQCEPVSLQTVVLIDCN